MTNSDLIAALDAALDANPGDRAARGAMADLHDEMGQRRLAGLHRWMLFNGLHPKGTSDHEGSVVWRWRCLEDADLDPASPFGPPEPHHLESDVFNCLCGGEFYIEQVSEAELVEYPARIAAEAALWAALAILGRVGEDGAIVEAKQ